MRCDEKVAVQFKVNALRQIFMSFTVWFGDDF